MYWIDRGSECVESVGVTHVINASEWVLNMTYSVLVTVLNVLNVVYIMIALNVMIVVHILDLWISAEGVEYIKYLEHISMVDNNEYLSATMDAVKAKTMFGK